MARSVAFFTDDNQRSLVHPFGMRPAGLAANILTFTMSASTQTGTLPTTASLRGQNIYRITGTQPILYAVDASGQSANYTGITNMILVPANYVEYFRIDPTDTTIYILQGGTAGTVQIAVMS